MQSIYEKFIFFPTTYLLEFIKKRKLYEVTISSSCLNCRDMHG